VYIVALPHTNLRFQFFPGYGQARWNQDVLGYVKRTGGRLREAADAIITKITDGTEKPLAAIEFCGAIPAGNQAWQRNGRAFSFARAGIPYFFIAKNTFKKSTGLCSVTQPFLDWSLNKADRSQREFDFVAPLTTQLANFNDADIAEAEKWLDAKGVEDNGQIRGSFVGTLNSAFDFQPIIDAAGLTSTQFVIAGDGPEASNLKTRTIQMQNIVMLGWVSSVQAHVLSKRSSFMLAPLKDLADFKMSVPNKFYDAMAHGLPIITSITGFAKNLVTQENIGITYSNSESLCEIINKLETDLLSRMRTNSINLYNKNFSFKNVYCNLIDHLKILTD
jgi:glycosyltransferase involved in cell wall biosynthesis